MPKVPQQLRPASTPCPGLQSCRLHADAGSAERGGALVADDAAEEAGQDWCQGHQTRAVRDLPIGRSGGGERPVPAHSAADRWAATGPFAAMAAAHPVASRSPDRTGVCGAGRSAPSQCKMVTGPGCSSSNQLDKERTTAYRASAGPDSRPDAHCATNVGNWGEPSGECRFRSIPHGKLPGAGLRQGLSVRHTGALLPFAHYLQLSHISPLNCH